jgi:hypothetical protein
MQIHIIQRAAITEPEKAIRRKRILDKITETDNDDSRNELE